MVAGWPVTSLVTSWEARSGRFGALRAHFVPRDARILAFERYGIFSCAQCFAETLACEKCSRPFWPARAGQAKCDDCRKQAA